MSKLAPSVHRGVPRHEALPTRRAELILTDNRIDLADVFIGPDGKILTGSARAAQQITDLDAATALVEDNARMQTALLRKRKTIEAKLAEMQADLAADTEEIRLAIATQSATAAKLRAERLLLAKKREHLTPVERAEEGGRA